MQKMIEVEPGTYELHLTTISGYINGRKHIFEYLLWQSQDL